MTRPIVVLVALLVALIVVVLGSMVAWRYFSGSTAQSPSHSVPAETRITGFIRGNVIVGKPLVYTVELSGGQSPTGTITVKIYEPDATPTDDSDNCGGTRVYTDKVNVDSGNGAYNADPFTPIFGGIYSVVANYLGDSNNYAAIGACEPIEVAYPREETTAYEEETTEEETTDVLGPPETTLSYGGREFRSLPQPSYCWGGGCFDGLPSAPSRSKTLYVPYGSEMVFHYESQSPPNKVTAKAARPYEGRSPYQLTRGPSRSLEVHGSGVERSITAELPPGEYLVFVYTKAPQGELYYIFRVVVQ